LIVRKKAEKGAVLKHGSNARSAETQGLVGLHASVKL